MSEQKRFELAVMAEELGGLPLPIETIIALEATGAVVDLVTGAVLPGRASHRVRLTVVGEAVAVAVGRSSAPPSKVEAEIVARDFGLPAGVEWHWTSRKNTKKKVTYQVAECEWQEGVGA